MMPELLAHRRTLRRQIERRMVAMASIETDGMERYLDGLKGDTKELDRLSMDLLNNATRLFRDPNAYRIPLLMSGRLMPMPGP